MLWVALSETIGASEEQNEVEEEIEGWDGSWKENRNLKIRTVRTKN